MIHGRLILDEEKGKGLRLVLGLTLSGILL